jgi:microcystin-dependent protein
MRQDGLTSNGGGLYVKMSGVTSSTMWTDLATASGTTAVLPSGLVMPFAGTTTPDGWLACDGSAVSRTTYSLLFTAIGTTYGDGDGSSTFNVPDLRGRLPVGQYPDGKTEVATLGGNEGLTDTNADKRNIAHIHYPGSAQESGNTGGWIPACPAS